MKSSSYTEEEFKQVLKNLFQEKKKVRELKKQLESGERFNEKIADIHSDAITDELKNTLIESEAEKRKLTEQLAKVKPALTKLVNDLKEAQAEIARLKEDDSAVVAKEHEVVEAKKKYEHLHAQYKEERSKREKLEAILVRHAAENEAASKEFDRLAQKLNLLQQSDIGQMHADFQEKLQQFASLHEQTLKVEEENQHLKSILNKQDEKSKERNIHADSLQQSLAQAKRGCEERDAEIRKAQLHLAKKVKEATILHDLAEKQKKQILEHQNTLLQQKALIEHMEMTLHAQKDHEERAEHLGKERAQAAETMAKKWQEKYHHLQSEYERLRGQVEEFEKLKVQYAKLSSAFSNLKAMIGKAQADEQK